VNPLLLIAELERFDLTARRRSVMRTLILWQSELGLEQLRLDAACGALSGLCGAERAFIQRNHARAELDALTRDGMVLLKQEPGALLVSIVPDSHFWRCSQIIDRPHWLEHINSLRTENGLEQLRFSPQSFSANEPTIIESIAAKSLLSPPGALHGAPSIHSPSPVPSYSHDSHNRNEFPLQESKKDGLHAPARPRASVKRLNDSTVKRYKDLSRLTVEKTSDRVVTQVTERYLMDELVKLLGEDEMKTSGGHWRVDHVRVHPEIVDELLGELRYKTKTGFIFSTNPAAWLEGSIKNEVRRATHKNLGSLLRHQV
jgi:hypothetical protein